MKTTTNLQLNKPDPEDFADIQPINENADKIDAAIAERASLNSPAFTGTPTAPTQARTNKSTRIATTAFVHSMYQTDTNFQIPHTGWVAVTKGKYKFKKEIAIAGVTVKTVPFLHYNADSEAVATAAKATYVETESGKIVIYAEKVPTATMTGTLHLQMGV